VWSRLERFTKKEKKEEVKKMTRQIMYSTKKLAESSAANKRKLNYKPTIRKIYVVRW